MRLIRWGAPGQEQPGLELEDGRRVDLSGESEDYTPAFFAGEGWERIRGLADRAASLPFVAEDVRLGPPVARPHKFLAIGLNYKQHARETGHPIPTEPVIFSKATSCISGPADDIIIPPQSRRLDYEVELAFVVKNSVRYLESEAEALQHIAGFMICNDVSERYFQGERGGQWTKGKSADSFGPLGPVLVSTEALPGFASLALSTRVNGELRQENNTNDMIFSVPYCLWYLSQFMALEPGDVVTTGTPEGVAGGMNDPAAFLKARDTVELRIEGLGTQRQRVRQG